MASAPEFSPVPDTWSTKVSRWADNRSSLLIWGTLIITALLVVPLAVMDTPPAASQNPTGRVFDLQDRIDEAFAAPSHFVPFIAESKTGDILTRESLSELLLSEIRLRAADARSELTPEDLQEQPFLLTYFDNNIFETVNGVTTIADSVEAHLQASTNGEVSLFEATEEQVKVAVHHVLATPQTADLVELLSTEATSERRVVNGEEIDWWVSPAIQFAVIADNEKLGGGTQAVGVSSDDRTIDKEEFNRAVQEVLRQDIESYELWGIAIDANLESEDQGQESGIFITFTVIAAIAVVGIALRSLLGRCSDRRRTGRIDDLAERPLAACGSQGRAGDRPDRAYRNGLVGRRLRSPRCTQVSGRAQNLCCAASSTGDRHRSRLACVAARDVL